MQQRGSVAILMVVMIPVLLLMGTLAVSLSSSETAIAQEAEAGLQARYLAEAGVAYGLRLIETHAIPLTQPIPLTLPDIAGTVQLTIKTDYRKPPGGEGITASGYYLIQANAAMVAGAKRVVEVNVQVDGTGEAEKLIIITQWEY